jgi:hypothetical protein
MRSMEEVRQKQMTPRIVGSLGLSINNTWNDKRNEVRAFESPLRANAGTAEIVAYNHWHSKYYPLLSR